MVKADDVTGYIDKELIKLNKNVYVKNINEKKEETVLTADRGTVTREMADVYDRVKNCYKKILLQLQMKDIMI